MGRNGDKNIVKEAVADAKAVREAAVRAARQKLVEEMSPTIKSLVERHINDSIEFEDVDRLRRAKDGYGETEFEEGKKDLEGDEPMAEKKDDKKGKDDKELEKESLNSMFPGISEIGDEEEEGELGGKMGGMGMPMMMKPEEEGFGMSYEMGGGMPPMGDDDEDGMMPREAGIPTLGEMGVSDEEEGEMDEEITIDEEGLRKAYESVMKSAAALQETSVDWSPDVTSGYADTYNNSKWETEDPRKDPGGLNDEDKSEAGWEEKKPPSAQDYTVKEAIEKGLKENQELARYVAYLEEQFTNATTVIRELKRQITEVNLFNRKVLHVNEILNAFGRDLTNEQKRLVITKIDEASTVREAKIVAEALKASFTSALNLSEGTKRRVNRPDSQRTRTSGSPDQKVLRESVDRNGLRAQFARQRELAGLVGSK